MIEATRRNLSIDIARAIAIGLVVFEHLLRCYESSLMPEAIMHSVIHAVSFFHVPVFFLLAGYCMNLSKRDITGIKGYLSFEWGKFQRLIIPYIIVCVVQLVLAIVAGKRSAHDALIEMSKAIVTPVSGPAGHGWFIMVLMSIFILWPLLNYILAKPYFLLFVIVSVLAFYENKLTEIFTMAFFQIEVIIRYLPLFALGAILAKRNKKALLSAKPITIILICVAATLFTVLSILLKRTSLLESSSLRPAIYSISGLAARIFGAMAVIKLSAVIDNLFGFTARFLAHLGQNSYGIYLYHMIVMMILMVIIEKLNLPAPIIIATSPLVFTSSIAVPYIGCKIINKNKVLSRIVLGEIS